MSDYLETLVADYLENFGLSPAPVSTPEPVEPVVEEVAPAPKKKRSIKKSEK